MTAPARGGAAPAPPREQTRMPLLDLLRGSAILGTLATNVWLFTAPGGEASALLGGAGALPMGLFLDDPSVSTLAEGLFRTAANGTFFALLTLMFGAGLALQYRSARKRDQRWPGVYKWRALFLFVEGTVHFTLVFAFDVLMGYAVVALLVAWLLGRSERLRTRFLWGSLGLHLALMSMATALLVLLPASEGQDEVPAEVVELYANGSYPDQIVFRLEHFLLLRAEPIVSFALMVFMFLLGVRLFRAGAFGDHSTGRLIRSRLLRWGLGTGVPFTLVAALGGQEWLLVDRYMAAPLVALGVIGLVGALLDRCGGTGPVAAGLSALGRMAMTGYVAQNLVLMLVCYGFGLGLTERMAGSGSWWILGSWAAMSLLLMAGSALWLRRFRQGPLEALQKHVLSRAR
ncbi:DUF418 domain-containing protein [Nocardiopsis xinjiangensis]|uniref:DUF418 domain-containing protein n=1 Tax=Nocardiopsis xinjiangensis TaxID=124285 RepID=UPI00034DF196|nr:DUF418 domain-containing protein [Nocardiopsis xinjiangensis]